MSYDDIIATHDIDNLCPEIDNELNGFFIDLIGDSFEMGIFPEPDPNNEDGFVVSVEITDEALTISGEQAKQIRDAVQERLQYNLGDAWSAVEASFGGVQIFCNDQMLD